MRHLNEIRRQVTAILTAVVIVCSYAASCSVPCLAADSKTKIDLGAISSFGKDYSNDDKGKFEISGVMVTGTSMYNITVDGDAIQAWCGELKGRTWRDQELKKLLNDPTTMFYGKVSGDLESAEFKDKVEFARPNGKTY